MVPVSEVQVVRPEVFGFGAAVVAIGVIVYWHIQVTFVFVVGPLTAAVSDSDWLTMTVADDGLTETVTTLAPVPPPQPLSHSRQAAARQIPRMFKLLRNFVLTISPTQKRRAPPAPALAFL